MRDGATDTGTALRVLMDSAQVAAISVVGVAEDLPGYAVELAAERSPVSDGAATAAAVVASHAPEVTLERLRAATAGAPGLLIVIDPESRSRDHVEHWALMSDDWLLLDVPPPGLEVLATVGTLALTPTLTGQWRGGRFVPPAAEAVVAHEESELDRATHEAARHEIDRLRAAWLADRAWVVGEAERIRATNSWRLGHRLVRSARLLTFRRDRGTDGLSRMAARMRAPIDP